MIEAKQLNLGDLKVIHNDQLPKLGVFLYPSAECGPISTEKARSVINWRSTPLSQAIQITTDFYVNIGPNFKKEHDFVYRLLLAMSNDYFENPKFNTAAVKKDKKVDLKPEDRGHQEIQVLNIPF